MLLMPDPVTANIDPFFEEPTLILTCDVVEPGDGKAYERDPRSLARAEAYLKASGLGDTAYFGPEPEFFIFDRCAGAPRGHSFYKIEEYEAPWNTGAKLEGGNRGHRPTVKGGYFPVPPVDSTQDMRAEMALMLESWASRSKCSTTKWPAPARTKSAPSSAPWSSARLDAARST
jgi:glutamine synthetase